MNVPLSISIVFAIITISAIFIFYLATQKNKKALLVISTILLLQGILSFLNFYNVLPLVPIKIPLVVAPSFFLIFYTLFSERGKSFINAIDLGKLTLLHTIRIPVEIVLLLLFIHKALPIEMTFEGQNFDVLAGITAPIIYYFAFIKNKIGPKGLLVWNVVSLLLLINIIITAVLSLEIPLQQFGHDQPNRAILYFPFIWLPSVVVPLVFFSHCAAIQRLLKKPTT